MPLFNPHLLLNAPLLSLTVSASFIPFCRPLQSCIASTIAIVPPRLLFGTFCTRTTMHTTSMPPVASSLSSTLPIRRSTRPRQRTSRYFSTQERTSSIQPATSTSRHLSSTPADVENMENIFDSDAIKTKKSASAATKKSLKGITTGPYTVSKSATAAQVTKKRSPSSSPSKSKRKAKTTSKNTTTTTTKKKKAKKAKTKSTTPIERTRSFEPVWWGNVLKTNTKTSLHPHAAAIASGKSNTPTPTPTTTKPETYPPVHTLILGTHPSIASLSKNEMYGHPLNAFWYLAGDALGFRRSSAVSPKTGKPYVYFHEHLRHSDDEILDYPQQLERMCGRGFAMWDIVAECEREGSLDTDIEGEVANPIREFCEGTILDGSDGDDRGMMLSEYLGIKRIVISNGTTGAKFFVKHFTDWFVDGKLFAAGDDMSQRVFKTVMNKARKANGNGSVELEEGSGIEVVCLPGVSPAAAKFTYLEKRDAWEKGCYGPGLADYEAWKDESRKAANSRQQLQTPDSKRSKSPRKSATSPSPSNKGSVRIVSSDLAALTPENEWVDLEVPARELRPSATLTNGQCFNWLVVDTEPAEAGDGGSTVDDDVASPQKQQQSAWGTHDAKEWIGPLQNRVISIRETPTTTLFRVLHGPVAGTKEDLRRYFRLETPLAPLYEEWSRADARLAKIATAIPGVRILRQDPLECMFSFICSSNNNIPRIAKMLSSFRERYGAFMMDIPARGEDSGGSSVSSLTVFSFPTLTSLAHATEEELRGMGLGYRAKFIIETRNLLVESGGDDFLLDLRTQRDAEAVQEELIKFSGIGRKVADCVALFSLDQDDAIPVDVHVQHIASRDYDPTVLGEAKSLTPTIYKRVGDLFRERFDSYPGWAHSLLFVAELPSFRGILPADVVREMDEWREHEQRKKLEKKEASKKAKAK